jgi:membrane fusion protein, multidrug efflux system
MYAESETQPERVEAPIAKSRRPQEAPPLSPHDEEQPPSRRRIWVRRGLFLLLPVILIVGALWYVRGGKIMTTDDAYVNADKVGVSSDVSGIVKAIDVQENQQVQAGQVLYRLDPLPFQLGLERANAQLGNVVNELHALKANYSDIEAQLAQAKTDVDYYSSEYNRQQSLLQSHVTSQAAVDTTTSCS